MKKRVLIVEDHALLRQGLCSLVSALPDFDVIGQACDGKEAVRKAVSQEPDLILMDLAMSGMNGIEASAQIKRRLPHIRIIALTAYHTDEYVRETLRAGADGYVLKDSSYEDLVLALRQVAVGQRFLSPDVSNRLVDSVLRGDQTAARQAASSPWTQLTSRERSVLKLIAEGNTNRAAAEYLNLSPKTVEKHRASLKRKLGVSSVSELTLVALESGLIESAARPAQTLGATSGNRSEVEQSS